MQRPNIMKIETQPATAAELQTNFTRPSRSVCLFPTITRGATNAAAAMKSTSATGRKSSSERVNTPRMPRNGTPPAPEGPPVKMPMTARTSTTASAAEVVTRGSAAAGICVRIFPMTRANIGTTASAVTTPRIDTPRLPSAMTRPASVDDGVGAPIPSFITCAAPSDHRKIPRTTIGAPAATRARPGPRAALMRSVTGSMSNGSKATTTAIPRKSPR